MLPNVQKLSHAGEKRNLKLRTSTTFAPVMGRRMDHYVIPHCFKSSTGRGSLPSSHSAHLSGVNDGSLDSTTHDKNSSPPFIYGGGETGIKTVGNRSSTDT